jgi:hypoxia up-regulated 1
MEQGEQKTPAPFREKLAEVRKDADPVTLRVRELSKRPEAVDKAREVLAKSRDLLKEVIRERKWLSDAEREPFASEIANIQDWLDLKLDAQSRLPETDKAAFTSDDVYKRLGPLSKIASELLAKPKPKDPEPEKKKANATKTNSSTDAGTDADAADETVNAEAGAEGNAEAGAEGEGEDASATEPVPEKAEEPKAADPTPNPEL